MRFHLPTILLIGLYWLLTVPTAAQDAIPAPQLLYRSENQLILLNGYTGEKTALALEVTAQDRFKWSPDGRYLLAWLQDGESYTQCLNLYEVDTQEWLHDEPISCGVQRAVFSAEGTQIVYAVNEEDNGVLRLYNLVDKTSEELYRTTDGEESWEAGISGIQWSPTGKYLTFIHIHQILGGTLNYFNVMNFESRHYSPVNSPAAYYADYDPIWSADDKWFLIILQEEYVTSGAMAYTNHRGDVYLVNSDTGQMQRITYTPADYEYDIHWTDEGSIAFEVTTVQKLTFTVEEAMNVAVVPDEAIVAPEPVDPQDYFNPLAGIMISPDENIGARIDELSDEHYELHIGYVEDYRNRRQKVRFSVPIENQYAVIGWRPSDYPYPIG